MHTDYHALRSQVDQIWDRLWTGGLSNPLDAIEQMSYLLFLKMLDDEETLREAQAKRRGEKYIPRVPEEIRWNHWRHFKGDAMLKHVREVVFPHLQEEMGEADSSFRRYMSNAEFKISKPSTLVSVVGMMDDMNLSAQDQDTQGDIYEYLLSHLNQSGRNGQFRTPRHIIRMIVEMMQPRPNERIGDLAAGTCGFLIGAYQYILEQHTEDWQPGDLRIGEKLTQKQRDLLNNGALRGYDNDAGMTMLRIGSMNLMLHGIDNPKFFYEDTLSQDYDEPKDYDLILMNPPFKGKVDKNDVHDQLPSNTTKSEILFIHRILRALDMGGRAAVIVPDGVLFGSTTAHREVRRTLVEDNRLEGVVSMPSGVFKPYSGVSTAVLIFTRGGATERVWFYDMAYDGFSLDDKREPTPRQNDIPDVVAAWHHRHDADFVAEREARLAELRHQLVPLQEEKLRLEAEIDRLTFESVISEPGDTQPDEALAQVEDELATLQDEMQPLKAEIDQLTRQFWVAKGQLKENKYDLSASRYREVEQDPVYYVEPREAMARIREINDVISTELEELDALLR